MIFSVQYKVVTIEEIEAQGWRLNLGCYVGASERSDAVVNFKKKMKEQNEELQCPQYQGFRGLEKRIAEDVVMLPDGEEMTRFVFELGG